MKSYEEFIKEYHKEGYVNKFTSARIKRQLYDDYVKSTPEFEESLENVKQEESIQNRINSQQDRQGIRRLPYLGIWIATSLIFFPGLDMIARQAGDDAAMLVATFLVISFVGATASRMKNIGINPLWCLGMFIPLWNFLIFIRCLTYKEGVMVKNETDSE